MAERTVTLTLSISEENALSYLVGWACNRCQFDDQVELKRVFAEAGSDALGRINSALNGQR